MDINKLIKEECDQIINEISLQDVDSDDVITDDFLEDFIGENGDNYIDIYRNIYDVDEDVDDDEILEDKYFKDFIREMLIESFEEAKDELYDNINPTTNKVELYRHMTVHDNWIDHLKKQGKRIGEYWSWDESAAEAHWGDSKLEYLAEIKSEIDDKYINWIETLEQNTHPSFKEEKEIKLFKNTPIKIVDLKLFDNRNREEIEIDDKDLNIIKNKTFYA